MDSMAVVVGKFQAPEPTEAHLELIRMARVNAPQVLIVIGDNQIKHEVDLVPYEIRKIMIVERLFKHYHEVYGLTRALEEMSRFHFVCLVDVFNPELWSSLLDDLITEQFFEVYGRNLPCHNSEILLVGGRDSFIQYYVGKYTNTRTVTLSTGDSVSATESRNKCAERFIPDPMFIAGAFHQAMKQYATSFQTVDVLIKRVNASAHVESSIVLGRKKNETKLVFIGGFSEPTSPSLEFDALKEVFEEASYTASEADLKYVYSSLVDDPRYRNSKHKIKTVLFTLSVDQDAVFAPGDDIVEIVEVGASSFTKDILMTKHHRLFDIYKEHGVI